MKIHKTITLDQELNQKLENTNASELINDLLLKYFLESKTIPQINKTTGDLQKQIKELEREKDKITQENTKNERIAKINLHPKLKSWLMKQKTRPKPLNLNTFMKDNKIPRQNTIIEILKEWEKCNA